MVVSNKWLDALVNPSLNDLIKGQDESFSSAPRELGRSYVHANEDVSGDVPVLRIGQGMVDLNDAVTDARERWPSLGISEAPTYSIVSQNNVKYFLCECGRKTTRVGDMTRHRESLRHSERRYSCRCGRRFTRRDGLARHGRRCDDYWF